jgi:hypothetical protein
MLWQYFLLVKCRLQIFIPLKYGISFTKAQKLVWLTAVFRIFPFKKKIGDIFEYTVTGNRINETKKANMTSVARFYH